MTLKAEYTKVPLLCATSVSEFKKSVSVLESRVRLTCICFIIETSALGLTDFQNTENLSFSHWPQR